MGNAHRLTKGDRLAIADRGDEARGGGGGIRQGRADDLLVALIGKAHGENRRALRENGGVEFAGALRDDAERDAVFAAFLGDPRNGLAGRHEAETGIGGNVAVGFLAHDEHVHAAAAPKADFEGHAAQHRRDGIDDFGGNARQLERRDRPSIAGNAENAVRTSTIVSVIVLVENMKRKRGSLIAELTFAFRARR